MGASPVRSGGGAVSFGGLSYVDPHGVGGSAWKSRSSTGKHAGARSPARGAGGRVGPDPSRAERSESATPKNKSALKRRRYRLGSGAARHRPARSSSTQPRTGPGRMKTAVQVRHPAGVDRPRAELLSGCPCAVVASPRGPVALFGAGEIVAYRVRCRLTEARTPSGTPSRATSSGRCRTSSFWPRCSAIRTSA